jgi:YidC/Oxa1 family membrane protein insertase
MKSKRGMMRMNLLNPQLQELQKKHGANQQKYQEEVQKLYREEGINPMSGCLWSLIPFPILIALYYAIREPLTTMMGISSSLISEGGAIYEKLMELGYETGSARAGYTQISMAKFISEHFESFEGITDKLRQINYSFFGIDLGSTPDFKIWNYDWSDSKTWLPALGLFMIPVVAALLTYLTTYVSQKMNPPADPSSAATTSSMNLMAPLMTLWFGFMMPGALGLYWAISSAISIIQDVILTLHYKKVLAAEGAEIEERRRQREAELEKKRKETERLRSMNATTENANTSKKKLQAKEKVEKAKEQAQWEKSQSGEEEEDEPSRVGHRKYARGHSYDPHRYDHNFQNTDNSTASEDSTDSDADANEDN